MAKKASGPDNHGPLGVSVIGAGDRGGAHARAWQSVPHANLVAVADVDIDRARTLGDELGIAVVTDDFRQAVERPDVQVVSVCTPAYFHPDMALFAIEQGKHVMCEKPVALSMALADRMADAARNRGIAMGICHQLRYAQSIRRIRDLVQADAIGRPVMIRQLLAGLEIRAKRAMHDLFRGNAGPVVDICCHQFDLAGYVLDAKPVHVTARGLTLAEGRPELGHIERLAPDTADIIVEYDTGDLQCVSVCWGLPPKVTLPGQQDICGPKGAIEWSSFQKVTLIEEGGHEQVFGPFDDNFDQACIRDFADSVLAGTVPTSSINSALVACRTSLAAMMSIQQQRSVDLTEAIP